MNIYIDRRVVLGLAVSPLLYNAVLAFLNAHVFRQSFVTAALSEIMILVLGCAYVFRKGVQKQHSDALVLLGFAFFGFVLSFIATGVIYVDFIRNVLVLAVFSLIGRELSRDEVVWVLKFSVVMVFGFLLVELINLELYVRIFEPAMYFEATRGNEVAEFNELGVFGNALGFEGRFGYGIFSGPRTSSVFLEQVGLANFIIVATISSIALAGSLSYRWRLFIGTGVIIGLLSNESRSALILVFSYCLFYKIILALGRKFAIFIISSVVVFGIIFSILYADSYGDNFSGRIALSFGHLSDLRLSDYFGYGVERVGTMWDSGYAYMVCSGTIFGVIGFWCYFFSQYSTAQESSRFFFMALLMFMLVSMSIGGNAVYSSKIAYLYSVLVGYFSSQKIGCDELKVLAIKGILHGKGQREW